MVNPRKIAEKLIKDRINMEFREGIKISQYSFLLIPDE